jgi:hypothetical protein
MKNSILLKIILSIITLVATLWLLNTMFNSQWWAIMEQSLCAFITYLIGTVTAIVIILIWVMRIKNHISVSFQVGDDVNNTGCVFTSIKGNFTFDGLKQKISTWAKDEYGYDIDPNDIKITGISEISKELNNRLVKL